MEQIIIGTVMVITGIAVILCKERIVNEVINLNWSNLAIRDVIY